MYTCSKCHIQAEPRKYKQQEFLPNGWSSVSIQDLIPNTNFILCHDHTQALYDWMRDGS